jgi:hypothetical protein
LLYKSWNPFFAREEFLLQLELHNCRVGNKTTGGEMVSKCVNPECDNTLHYLRDGKIFSLIVKKTLHHFWLCEECRQAYVVKVGDRGQVELVPLAEGAAIAQSGYFLNRRRMDKSLV